MVAKNGKARLAGVIGDPITHSLSPAIHEYWLRKYDINGAYVPLRMNTHVFETSVRAFVDAGFVGFNVTLPHKQAAYALAQSHDDTAHLCHAVNTLVVKNDGSLYGMNTDAYGFVSMVEDELAQAPFSLESVMVFGAGGSARAVVAGLAQLGCRSLVLVNRTRERAEALVHDMQRVLTEMQMNIIDFDQVGKYAREAQTVVNTLSVGQTVPIQWDDFVRLTANATMMIDISYGRYGTEMTKEASKAKRRSVDGLNMLLKQAVLGFEQWFGVMPEVDEGLIAHVRAASEIKR
jgi:shikimate dehydrogenase